LKLAELQTKRKDAAGGSMEIKAPMPSKIAHILVKDGQKVKKGEPLLVLEAMKMEHVMRAGNDGTVDKIKFTIGDMVKEGQILVTFSDK
jgi:3-methylcrotonyl-CoA carboxylase alpha subunit